MVGSHYRRLRGDPSPGLAPGPKGMAEPGQEPYQDDFGQHSCPRVTGLSSYNNRTRVSYPRCSSPLMELVICSTPSTDHQRGWSQVSLESFHPTGPPLLSLCSRLAPSASILSSSFYPSEKAEETLKKSIQPNGKPGVGEGATYLLPSISKVWGRAQRNGPQEPSGTPIPLASLTTHHHYTQHWRNWGSHKEEAFHHLP